MDIDKVISKLPGESLKVVKDRLANADRVLASDPSHTDALCLKSATQVELSRRKAANRKKVGQLWWEPHDPQAPEFHAFETATSVIPVAAIFKSDTHTATRKDVYVIRIGECELAERFSEVAVARQAGADRIQP